MVNEIRIEQEMQGKISVQELDGYKIITDFSENEQGQKIKITRKVKLVMKKSQANHAVAERSRWKKFGAAAKGSSFEDGTTVVTEETSLILKTLKEIANGVDLKSTQAAVDAAKKPKTTTISCRHCKGDHWTTKCPYKDTIGSLDELLDKTKLSAPNDIASATTPISTSSSVVEEGKVGPSKYVPPSMRAGKTAEPSATYTPPGSRRFAAADDKTSLRVTNLSEDATDEDLLLLFSPFGPLSRCYLAKDRDTGRCKGFAFVSYRSREDAERALEKMNGRGFDNLILTVEWSTPK